MRVGAGEGVEEERGGCDGGGGTHEVEDAG